jgi:peptidoglycan/LPS O-acetylase OafA/YrhL
VSTASRALCLGSAVLAAAVQPGFHGVAVFLVFSGFGLSYSLTRTDRPAVAWPRWYRSRLIRLLPMYCVARAIGRLRWVGAAAIAVGASSYGLYLAHQPYVLYFGARMRSLDTAAFAVGAGEIIAILVLGATMPERGVNALTSRVLG